MLGTPEIIIIVLVVVLLFGSTQLPKLARSLGQAQKEFKHGLDNGADEDEKKAEGTKGS
jgi:sec-independent protein translocase protein TatA